jgi:hypothetical protein
MANGFDESRLDIISVAIAAMLAVGILVWAQVLSLASIHGFSLLIAAAVFLAPPSILIAVAQDEVSTFTYLGRSNAALIICGFALFLEGMRSSAMWAAKIRILGSRWRLLSYGTLSLCLSQFCAFLSPLLCEAIARYMGDATFLTRNQKELADAVIAASVPLAIAQYFVQMMAAPVIHGDLGGARRRPDMAVFGRPLILQSDPWRSLFLRLQLESLQ